MWHDFWFVTGAFLAVFLVLIFSVAYDSRQINERRRH